MAAAPIEVTWRSTLSLRVERHIENARAVAEYLEAHPQVDSVRWASLASSPSKALADKYAPKGAGAVLAFVPGIPAVSLDPDVVLVMLLPPLLYASGVNMS